MVPEKIAKIRESGENMRKGLKYLWQKQEFCDGYVESQHHRFLKDDRGNVCGYLIHPITIIYCGGVENFDVYNYNRSEASALSNELEKIHIPYDTLYDVVPDTWENEFEPESNNLVDIINYLYGTLAMEAEELPDILIGFSENIISTPRP